MKRQIKLDEFQEISGLSGNTEKFARFMFNMNNIHGMRTKLFHVRVEKYHRKFILLTSQKAHLC